MLLRIISKVAVIIFLLFCLWPRMAQADYAILTEIFGTNADLFALDTADGQVFIQARENIIEKEVIVNNKSLHNDLDFSCTLFIEDIKFIGCTFQGRTIFKNSTFG